jgi:hypothetical protein
MPVMRRRFAFLFLLLLYFSGICQIKAQTDFKPGYIITYANDTIHGYINYSSDTLCNFRQNENAELKYFKPTHISGFRFNNGKYFCSKDILEGKKRIKVFLDVLVDGLTDLYCLKNRDSERFFIQKSGGDLVELIANNKEYIRDLKVTFSDNPRFFREINTLTYSREPLMFLVKRYNRSVSSEKNEFIVKPPMVEVKTGAFVSLNKSHLTYSDARIYDAFNLDSWMYPSAGILVNISFPKILRILSFQISGEMGKDHLYGNAYNPLNINSFDEINIYNLFIKGKAGFKFTYPRGKIRPSLFLGGSQIHMLSKDGTRLEDSRGDQIIYINSFKENVTSRNIYGYAVDLGFDFHHSKKLMSFFSIGATLNEGTNNTKETWLYQMDETNAILSRDLTFNLSAGLYF